MRDNSHEEQVERWARFVRDNPRSEWIKHIKPFVDSQIISANKFYAELSKSDEGKEKIAKIRALKN